jgi:hypothetical protein
VKLFRIDRRRAESRRSAGVRTGALTFPARVTQKTHFYLQRKLHEMPEEGFKVAASATSYKSYRIQISQKI